MDGTATTPSISRAAGTSCKPSGGALHPGLWLAAAPPPPRRGADARRRTAAGLVPVHREQRAFADRGGADRRRCRRERSTPRRPGAIRSRCIRNAVRVMKQARDRHQREPHQARRRVRRAALRRRDHAVRSGPRGVPGVPVAPGPRALEHPGSRARGAERSGHPAGVRAHRRPSSRRGSGSCSICSTNQRPGGQRMPNDETVNVRYMVDDVDAVDRVLHRALLGFEVLTQRVARVRRRQARQSAPAARRARELRRPTDARRHASPDRRAGTASTSSSTTSTTEVARLRGAGATFRNDIVEGPGGKQILLLDPSGNVVELFQPAGR